MFKFNLKKITLQFKHPSGTSRGVLTEKHSWYVTLSSTDSANKGIGEISIIPGLTPEFKDLDSYQKWLDECIDELNQANLDDLMFMHFIGQWYDKPSLFFGLETAFHDFIAGGNQVLYDTPFTHRRDSIPINGLIWMGDEKFMQEQIEEKLKEGYKCIKLKIGAIDFETEIRLLTGLRERFSPEKLTLRVDANGAFSPEEAPEKLQRLAELSIHSIEQPIKAGNWNEMAKLCASTPCPIALDEELIGVYDFETKTALLNNIRPQYIILKPSLHGGIQGCQEWIELAHEKNIEWWITSALESNVGLSAIAQFVSNYSPELFQGLGTGSLYVQNSVARTEVKRGKLYFIPPRLSRE